MNSDALVDDYLRQLDASAAALPPDRRADLLTEVREHIETALGEAGRRDEATVRNVLDRLGSPDAIVASEMPSPGTASPAPPPPATASADRPSWGRIEVAALLAIGLAWPALFVPFGGVWLWLALGVVGLVLVWLSRAWSRRAKVIATVIVVLAYALVPALELPVRVECSTGTQSIACPTGGPSPVVTSVPVASP